MPQRRSPRAAPPRSRACAASAPCSGSIQQRSTCCRAPVHQNRRAARRCDGRPSIVARDRRSGGSLAVGLMATAAILAHLGDLNLEAVEILGGVHGGLGIAGKLGEPGGEIGLVFPNRRQCRGIPAGLGSVREERRRFIARLGEGRERLLRCGEIEGLLGLQHVGGDLALIAVGFHQCLAGSDRVALRHQRGGAEREHCNDERGADHLSCSLCGLISAPGGAGWAASRKHPDGFFYSRRGENWNPAGMPDLRVTTSLQRFASDFKPKNTPESWACQRPPVPKRYEEVLPRAGELQDRAPNDHDSVNSAKGAGGRGRVTAYASAYLPRSPPRAAPPLPACPHGGCGKPARAHPRWRSSPPGKTRWRPPPPPPSPPADWSGTGRCRSRRRAAGYRPRAAGHSPSTRR